MSEKKESSKNDKDKKDKIRDRYRKADTGGINVTPAIPQKNIFKDDGDQRVAVYVRVSTDSVQQTSSFELQQNYYTGMIDRHPHWHLVGIYADEGISGTSLKKRDQFNRMIEDCRAGKIDLVVTKSVSRFSRSVKDFHIFCEELKFRQPPVGIYFEMEGKCTLDDDAEEFLSMYAMQAQQESHIKSNSMNMSFGMRCQHGLFLTPPLLGFDQDEDGNLVINEKEAQTVRLAFYMYLAGYTCRRIAEKFTALKRKTKKNNTKWSPKSILSILQNEKPSGAAIAQKTFTPHYLTHKSKKNRGERNKYEIEDHHERIISRDDFIAVQCLISKAKYNGRSFFPELKVIPGGALKGFVSIHLQWPNFTADHYRRASDSVFAENDHPSPRFMEVTALSGDFDLRGFEVVRSQFFNTANKLCVTFSATRLWFGIECMRKFGRVLYVEMLLHPKEHLLAVRACSKDSKAAIKWANLEVDSSCPREVCGSAFLNVIYDLCGWNQKFKYRVCGVHREKDGESLIIFDMREPEAFIPASGMEPPPPDTGAENDLPENAVPVATGDNAKIVAFPSAWADSFGSECYCHAQARELASIGHDPLWNVAVKVQSYQEPSGVNATSTKIAAERVAQLIREMESENACYECEAQNV